MNLFAIFLLLTMSSTPAEAQGLSLDECYSVFIETYADIHLALNVTAEAEDVFVGDVQECLMQYTNMCEINNTDIKIMNASISDHIIRDGHLLNTTFNGIELKCIVDLMPSLQFNPCQVLRECVPEFTAYENCSNMYDRMKQTVKQNCDGAGELSASVDCACVCDPLFAKAGECQNVSSHDDKGYNEVLTICDCKPVGETATEAPISPYVRVTSTVHWYPIFNEEQAIPVFFILLAASLLMVFCYFKFSKYICQQNRDCSTELFPAFII